MAVPFDLLDVGGSYREIGRQIGEGARLPIERCVASYEADFESFAGMSLSAAEALIPPFVAAAERSLPQYVEELRGLAEGAAVPFSRLMLLNCGEELTCSPSLEPGHCTSLALAGGGRTVVAHNEDWEARDIENQVLLRIAAPDGTRILAMATAGVLPLTGLNSHGLAFGANTVYARDQRPGGPDATRRPGASNAAPRSGVPNSLVCRWMLEAASREEATARALMSERARGSNHLCGQAGGRVWDVETSAERAAVIERGAVVGDWEWLAHTNHYLTDAMLEVEDSTSEGSRLRRARACELMTEGLRRDLDPVELAGGILRDHDNAPTSVCCHGGEGADAPSPTTASMVWELEERRMHVCAGPPCENPYRVVSLD